jgi:hypothetical protein
MLKSDLNLYPYKMTVWPKLTVQNKHQRMAFVEWPQNNEVFFNKLRFSDEAHFHLDVVNMKNVQFLVLEDPRVIHEKVRHAPSIAVWVAILSDGLLGTVFFEETVNSECYLSMLCSTFVPHLLAIDLPLQTQQFIQDGARNPHSECCFGLSA